MHRTDANGFAPGNLFQEGSPGTGLLASRVGSKWLNALQDELAAIVAGGGLALDDEDNGQVLAALGILFSAGNGAAVLKNRIINGAFELWQRGLSHGIAAGNFAMADRWFGNGDPAGPGTATVTRQDFPIGHVLVDDNPKHYLRWVQGVAATGVPLLFQTLEDVARYSSGQLTVSFWARAGATLNGAVSLIQNFGSGGSTAVTVAVVPIAVTTTWQKFAATVTLPSVAGKTIGLGNYLRVGVRLPQASTFTFEIADFQVEAGAGASAFDRRPQQLEYILAARYYEKSYALETAPGTATRAGALHRMAGSASTAAAALGRLQERFRVPKRTVPTITWYAPDGEGAPPWDPGVGKISSLTNAGALVAIPVTATTATSAESTGYPTRGDVSAHSPMINDARSPAWAHWTADAELL